MQKALILIREMYSFWTSKTSDKRILLLESVDPRVFRGLSCYNSDLQWNLIGIFKLRQRMGLSYKILQKGRSLLIQSVSRNLE